MKKLINLIEKLAEVPGAIIRLVENDQLTDDLKAANRALEKQNQILSTEVEHFRNRSEENCVELSALNDLANELMVDYDTCHLPNLQAIRKVIADLELYKSRDIESRRWREQSEEPCPLSGEKWILWRSVGDSEVLGCTAKDISKYDEWRYVSQEDMP